MQKNMTARITIVIGMAISIESLGQSSKLDLLVDTNNPESAYLVQTSGLLNNLEFSKYKNVLQKFDLKQTANAEDFKMVNDDENDKNALDLAMLIRIHTGHSTKVKSVKLKDMINSTQEGIAAAKVK